MARYAIYYAPPAGHPLARAAAEWLGSGEAAAVAEPRRYGFHATLKAPFRLADGVQPEDLEGALAAFARAAEACPLGRLRVALFGRFIGLGLATPTPELLGLAGRVVAEFDRFRAPLTPAERQRRQRSRLDGVAAALLERWGYPHVFERFRFHMSLTGPLEEAARAALLARLEARFAPLLGEALAIDALSLFEEACPGADFRVHARFALQPNAGG